MRLTAKIFAERTGIDSSPENLLSMARHASRHEKSMTSYLRVRNDFQEHTPLIKKGIILDAGCSDGATTQELAVIYPKCKIIGLEARTSLIKYASYQNNPKMKFLAGNFYTLPFANGTLSGIFAMNNLAIVGEGHRFEGVSFLEHLTIADGFHRTLKQGGFLCISGNGGRAVLQKDKEDWKQIHVNDKIRCLNDFPHLPKVYGFQGYIEGV
jgi:SAM-dependent methyltransferase